MKQIQVLAPVFNFDLDETAIEVREIIAGCSKDSQLTGALLKLCKILNAAKDSVAISKRHSEEANFKTRQFAWLFSQIEQKFAELRIASRDTSKKIDSFCFEMTDNVNNLNSKNQESDLYMDDQNNDQQPINKNAERQLKREIRNLKLSIDQVEADNAKLLSESDLLRAANSTLQNQLLQSDKSLKELLSTPPSLPSSLASKESMEISNLKREIASLSELLSRQDILIKEVKNLHITIPPPATSKASSTSMDFPNVSPFLSIAVSLQTLEPSLETALAFASQPVLPGIERLSAARSRLEASIEVAEKYETFVQALRSAHENPALNALVQSICRAASVDGVKEPWAGMSQLDALEIMAEVMDRYKEEEEVKGKMTGDDESKLLTATSGLHSKIPLLRKMVDENRIDIKSLNEYYKNYYNFQPDSTDVKRGFKKRTVLIVDKDTSGDESDVNNSTAKKETQNLKERRKSLALWSKSPLRVMSPGNDIPQRERLDKSRTQPIQQITSSSKHNNSPTKIPPPSSLPQSSAVSSLQKAPSTPAYPAFRTISYPVPTTTSAETFSSTNVKQNPLLIHNNSDISNRFNINDQNLRSNYPLQNYDQAHLQNQFVNEIQSTPPFQPQTLKQIHQSQTNQNANSTFNYTAANAINFSGNQYRYHEYLSSGTHLNKNTAHSNLSERFNQYSSPPRNQHDNLRDYNKKMVYKNPQEEQPVAYSLNDCLTPVSPPRPASQPSKSSQNNIIYNNGDKLSHGEKNNLLSMQPVISPNKSPIGNDLIRRQSSGKLVSRESSIHFADNSYAGGKYPTPPFGNRQVISSDYIQMHQSSGNHDNSVNSLSYKLTQDSKGKFSTDNNLTSSGKFVGSLMNLQLNTLSPNKNQSLKLHADEIPTAQDRYESNYNNNRNYIPTSKQNESKISPESTFDVKYPISSPSQSYQNPKINSVNNSHNNGNNALDSTNELLKQHLLQSSPFDPHMSAHTKNNNNNPKSHYQPKSNHLTAVDNVDGVVTVDSRPPSSTSSIPQQDHHRYYEYNNSGKYNLGSPPSNSSFVSVSKITSNNKDRNFVLNAETVKHNGSHNENLGDAGVSVIGNEPSENNKTSNNKFIIPVHNIDVNLPYSNFKVPPTEPGKHRSPPASQQLQQIQQHQTLTNRTATPQMTDIYQNSSSANLNKDQITNPEAQRMQNTASSVSPRSLGTFAQRWINQVNNPNRDELAATTSTQERSPDWGKNLNEAETLVINNRDKNMAQSSSPRNIVVSSPLAATTGYSTTNVTEDDILPTFTGDMPSIPSPPLKYNSNLNTDLNEKLNININSEAVSNKNTRKNSNGGGRDGDDYNWRNSDSNGLQMISEFTNKNGPSITAAAHLKSEATSSFKKIPNAPPILQVENTQHQYDSRRSITNASLMDELERLQEMQGISGKDIQ